MLGGKELERAINWIYKQTCGFSVLNSINNDNLEIALPELIKDSEYYFSNPEWASDYTKFYKYPDSLPQVKSELIHGLKNGGIIDIQFESSYHPRNPSFSEICNKYQENNTVHARYWQHTENARATIIALHGWTMGDQRLNSLAFLPGYYYRLGYDVLLVELPFHGRRKPQELSQAEADSLFPGSNMALTNEVIAQFIHDLRQLKMFIDKYGTAKSGCIGMSLGAYFASLWAMLDPLDFCIPVVPMSSMSEIAWKALKRHPDIKKLKKEGLSKDILDKGFSVHCPLSFQPRTSKDNVMILAGLADQIIPSSQPRALWKHWGKPELHWFRGGHLLQFKSRRALEMITKFLSGI